MSQPYTVDFLCELSAKVIRRTDSEYSALGGNFDSSKGELCRCNVSASIGGRSYMSFQKVPQATADFCRWLNCELTPGDGNDIETSWLLYSVMFCTNQKNTFLICKSSVFISYYQGHSSEKWRKFNVKYKALPKHSLPKLNHKYVWHCFHLCCNQDS